MNEKLKELSLDLTKEFPRSPRAKLGLYIIAARTLDKCRATLCETEGEYHYDCPLDNLFFDFIKIKGDDFKAAVAEGRTDKEIIGWIQKNSEKRSEEEIIAWNNDLRYKRISEMPLHLQKYLEGYIDENIPKNKTIYHWFDVYDIEEKRF